MNENTSAVDPPKNTVARKQLGPPFAVGRTAEVFDWQEGTILKLYRDWCPPDWVEHEARTARMVHQAGIPSPAAGEIVTVEGRRGLLYERIEGCSMLEAITKNPLSIVRYGRMLGQLHVQMHGASGTGLQSQKANFAYAIDHALHLPDRLRRAALDRLAALPDADRLTHGDFHPGNLILTAKGPMVIDWMTAAMGHPAADVARTYLLLTIGDPPQGSLLLSLLLLFRGLLVRAYLNTYKRAVPEILAQTSAWYPVIAAARMNEDIAPEREKLLRLIEVSFERPVF